MEAVEVPPGQLLRITEVSRRLSVTTKHVYVLINSGELPTINIGTGHVRQMRIAESDLETFIRNRRSHTQP